MKNLCKECDTHFKILRNYLDSLNRPYQINHRMVRGLDYYTKTVFEIWAQGIGAQNAICGGGRYDGLSEILGGPPTPAVGFASGLERIVMILQNQKIDIPRINIPSIYIMSLGEDARTRGIQILNQLREAGLISIMGYGNRSFKAQMRESDRRGVGYTIIIGEDEISKKEATIKNMTDGTQESVAFDDLISYFKKQDIRI